MAVANCIVASKMQGKVLGTSIKAASEASLADCPHPPHESVSRAVESATEVERASLEKLPDEILTQVRNAACPSLARLNDSGLAVVLAYFAFYHPDFHLLGGSE